MKTRNKLKERKTDQKFSKVFQQKEKVKQI